MDIFSSSKLMLLFLIQMCYKWGDVDHNFLWTVCSRSWYCCIGLSIDKSYTDDEGRQILKQTIGLRKKIYWIENEKGLCMQDIISTFYHWNVGMLLFNSEIFIYV